MGSLPSRGRVCAALRALSFGALLLMPGLARAAEPTLEIAVGGETRSYTRDERLARPDAATIEVVKDIAYGGPMTYRAVPVAALLSGLNFPPDSVVQAVAIDGFAAKIPLELLRNTDATKPIAWVAIETADHPWPKIAGKDYTAGPLYVVWTGPEVASIRSEYWAYQLAKFERQLSPVARWPGLAVDQGLPADDPARRRCFRCRAGPQSPDESDRIHDGHWAARSDPRSEIGAQLARDEDERLATRSPERQRDRTHHRLSQAHGWPEGRAVALRQNP